jgi:hypothetical protein
MRCSQNNRREKREHQQERDGYEKCAFRQTGVVPCFLQPQQA